MPPLSVHLFGESKFESSDSCGASTYLAPRFIELSEISDNSLPLMSLESLVQSGRTIQGDISFDRSDIAPLESSITAVVSNYVSQVPSKSKSNS